MIPLRDENPTRISPFITFAIIAACVLIYFGPQQGVVDETQAIDFNLEYAAIPCELRTGDPLSIEEIDATFNRGNSEACVVDDTTESAFPSKIVYLGAFTSMFLHGSILHLLGNMWSLWIFGNNIEDRLGHLRYLIFYLAGGVVATIAHFLVQPSSTVPVVGASGAIAAVMGAYLVWFPNAPIRTLIVFVLRDVSAKWFLAFWFVSQFFTGANSGVAWMAHVGGFVFGVVIGLLIRTTDFGSRNINRSGDPLQWDNTGGVGRGPLPHPLERRRNPYEL
ncbi:MAG: rhomboid family intramembrane serine protease [Acidimicrobiia bacterium]|nr:rhomboid family intramembrane serine protease [Acidimicrobiia bacterium]